MGNDINNEEIKVNNEVSPDNKIGDSMLDRIEKKLNGQDPDPNESVCYIKSDSGFYNNRFYRCGSYFNNEPPAKLVQEALEVAKGADAEEKGENEKMFEWDVPEQVDRLINIAKDPLNYMQHYPGWCPFW